MKQVHVSYPYNGTSLVEVNLPLKEGSRLRNGRKVREGRNGGN